MTLFTILMKHHDLRYLRHLEVREKFEENNFLHRKNMPDLRSGFRHSKSGNNLIAPVLKSLFL